MDTGHTTEASSDANQPTHCDARIKNQDVSTEPLTRPFASTAHSSVCSYCSIIRWVRTARLAGALIRSLTRLLTHLRARGKVNDLLHHYTLF